MKVFLDANILFSAAKVDSSVARLIGTLTEADEAVTSALAVLEARRNLKEKRPEWLPQLNKVMAHVALVPEANVPLAIELVAKDRPIVGAAVAAHCTHLLPGDFKHFGPLLGREVGGVRVVSVKILVEEFRSRGWLEDE